jgi:hypothetical protein
MSQRSLGAFLNANDKSRVSCMEYKGHQSVEELSEFVTGESPRCVVIVSAAFFDETLPSLLGDTNDRAFDARRTKSASKIGPLPEPSVTDFDAWPPVTST